MERVKIRTDLALAFGAQLGFKLTGYIILALLARHLPREAFGQFFYLSALAALLVLLTELGSSNYLVRAVAQDRSQAAADFVDVMRVRLPLMAAFVLLVGTIQALTDPGLVWAAVAVAAFTGLKDLYRASSSILYGLRRVALAQAMYGFGQVVAVLLVLWAVQGGATLREVVLAYLAWGVVLFGGGLILLRSLLGPIPWRAPRSRFGTVLRLSLPLFAVDLLALVHLKVDTVMLGLLRPMNEVAAYEAGAKLLEASRFLVHPMTLIFYPILAALAAEARFGRLRSLLGRILGVAVILAVALAFGVWLLAPRIVPAVFGSGFDASIPLLRILFLGVPGVYVAVIGTFAGNALHMERRTVTALLGAVALNLGLNAVAIPRYGAAGAAWATVASQTFLGIVLAVVVLSALSGGRDPAPDARSGAEAGVA